jgi:hypothetical protein
MDKAALREAAELLIQTSEYISLRRQIKEMVAMHQKRETVFAGGLISLNVLIDLGVRSESALENFFAMVERKRRVTPSIRKVDYQRDYMRQRRTRLANAVRLEEIVRSKQLTPVERRAYEAATLAAWMAKRDELLAAKPDADWKTRNRIVGEFWLSVDRQLAHDLEEAEKVLAYPGGRRRRIVRVDKRPTTVLGRQLYDALKGKK